MRQGFVLGPEVRCAWRLIQVKAVSLFAVQCDDTEGGLATFCWQAERVRRRRRHDFDAPEVVERSAAELERSQLFPPVSRSASSDGSGAEMMFKPQRG